MQLKLVHGIGIDFILRFISAQNTYNFMRKDSGRHARKYYVVFGCLYFILFAPS